MRQDIGSSIVLTWLIDYIKLQFREAFKPANLARIEVGPIMKIYQRLMIGVQSTFLSMDVRSSVYTGLINT